jgi:MoaA/NifB/PqqE/SkfB family radical SAM enzyme
LTDNDNQYRTTFDTTIGETISQAIRIIARDPALVIPGTVILHNQKKAAQVRTRHEKEGLLVPPVMITSITSRCNLSCAGCYMHGRGERTKAEMSPVVLTSVVDQAAELGVSIIVIAGGEPLIREDEILTLARAHPAILFPVFTNGLMIDEGLAEKIAGCRNIVPVISFEGFREDTDTRRGSGVFDRLLAVCALLRSRNIFFGCSLTTSRENFGRVTSGEFIHEMLDTGARAFTFVEFVPMAPGTEDLVLTPEQKATLSAILAAYNQQYPAIFIGFPGDEDTYGGCLAAGRGFVHVSPSGDLEPCPAAPFSDASLAAIPLKDALRSRLLSRIRGEHGLLTESSGGCALRANRAWVQELVGK